ncbi:Tn3 family transposase [Streptomyces sp. NPDC048187]|uniref:Tn3 family transposase n=1 Tax=Streptomyces sp. NPDC048187 TaxID=3365509 RepID=UPI0037194EB4
MLTVVWGLGWAVTSIERTAYPRFKRLITAHELHMFFSPTRDELEWAAEATDGDGHLLALLLMLKSYQRMGSLLTNAVVFHNALDIAEIVRQLLEEGWEIDPEDLAHISPYLTEHINRFGEYPTHELGLQPEAYDPKLDVDFTPLREQDPTAAGFGQAA